MLSQKFDEDFMDAISIAALQQAGDRVFSIGLEPLFEQALAYREVTAWVCANDDTALEHYHSYRHEEFEYLKIYQSLGSTISRQWHSSSN